MSQFVIDSNRNLTPIRSGIPIGGVFTPGGSLAVNTWHHLMPYKSVSDTKIEGENDKLKIGDLRSDIANANVSNWLLMILTEGYQNLYKIQKYDTFTTTESSQVEDTPAVPAVAEAMTTREIQSSDFVSSGFTTTGTTINWRGSYDGSDPSSRSRGDVWYRPDLLRIVHATSDNFFQTYNPNEFDGIIGGDTLSWRGNRTESELLSYFRSNGFRDDRRYAAYNETDSQFQIITSYTAAAAAIPATYRTEYTNVDTEDVVWLEVSGGGPADVSKLPDAIEFLMFPEMLLPFTLLNRADSANDVEIGYSPTYDADNVVELTKKSPGESFVLPANGIETLFFRYASVGSDDQLEWGEHYSV